MSYAGLGQTSTAMMPAATVGRSTSRHEAGGAVRVPATWAQRAANAGNRYNNSSAPLIAVDGRAGPITIAALRTLSHQFSSDQPVTNDPPTSRVTDNVIIPVALETALAARRFVPDPPVSSATRRTTTTTRTTTSGGTTTTPVTTPIPGATPAATPADEVILDEGSSSGVRGLIAQYGIWPWAIGGAALVGLGLWFLAGGGMRANRRRVRKNYAYEHMSHPGSYDPRGRPTRNRITPAQRRRISKKSFVFPSRRAWPIDNARRAYAAIQFLRMGRVRSASDFNEIRNAVIRRYPDVWAIYGKNLTWERSKASKAKRQKTKARRTTRGARRRIAANGYRGPGFKRVPRVGTRVVFDPNPASLALYSTHPRVGEAGTVQTVAGPGGPMRAMRGPGGGLVYVDWDESRFQGVSLHDLSKSVAKNSTVSRAWRDSGGTIHFGDWIVPALGSSRFKTKKQADDYAKWFMGLYPGVFGTKVVKERSRSRRGAFSYQVYIRSLGKMEGLR